MREKRLIYTLLALTTLPHIFHLPILLNLYLAIFVLYLLLQKGENRTLITLFFAFLGLSFGFVEYVRYINVTDLSKAKVFIDIVSSLLIFVTSLLILDKFSSPFIKVAPTLLLLSSLFYFENIIFLLYAIFVLFVTVAGVIYTNSNIDSKSAIRYTLSMFIASFPIVILLFFTFPRISYKNSSFGFKGSEGFVTGFGDKISFGSGKKVLQSNKVAMEVFFKDKIPPANQLYFRGAIFYEYNGTGWLSDSDIVKFKIVPRVLSPEYQRNQTISYVATIYPTFSKNIPQLDYPLSLPRGAKITTNYTIELKKELLKSKKFSFQSVPNAKIEYINHKIRAKALQLFGTNPKSKNIAKKIRASSKDDKDAVENLKNFFASLGLEYTLSPPKLKSKDKIDEFIFESKRGYCVHISSSFAYMLRAMGIPARVVSGYKADAKSMLNQYLIVRAKDAHSWVEAYIQDNGWVRIDPTKYAKVTADSNLHEQKNPLFERATLWLMYVKYKIEDWVLYYSRVKQIKLLNILKNDTTVLLYILMLFLLVIATAIYFSKVEIKKRDRVSKVYDKFLKKMQKRGINKLPHEGAKSFCDRVDDERVEKITDLYLQLKYKKEDKRVLKELKREIKKFK